MPDTFTANPTLIVGVGGTGLKVATYVKKAMLEINHNQMPLGMALLVLDTETKIRFEAGGWGKKRSEHHATGPVAIDGAGEYLALSKDVKDAGKSIKSEQAEAAANPRLLRTQPHRHISPWFQATHYIDEAVIDAGVWNLNVGAGRYRQFGRLALFTHINEITQLLLANMRAIRALGRNELYVHVSGSLAGGTGAALFVDVPHLIKKLAPVAGFTKTPVIMGHFVLPEGFTGTPAVQLRTPGIRSDFDARCFAALRELTRLQGQSIPRTGGYPISYDPGGVEELNSRLTESPYSALYLYDGVRDRNPLNTREIENGLAPAIADAIVSYVDDLSGSAFCAHSVNYKAFYNGFEIPQGQPTYGSVSTYTIELPIYHVTEGWAHALAREALDRLLEPLERDVTSEIPTKLDGKQPGGQVQNPAADAEDWMRSSTTALVRQLGDWGKQAEQGVVIRNQIVDAILQRSAQVWQEELAPHDAAWEERVADARMELEGSLRDQKSAKYYVSHEQTGNSPEQRAANMITEVESKLRVMVGDTRDVWMRAGGDFKARLSGLALHHARAFDDALLKRMRLDLNGDANTGTPLMRKRGKLGYTRAFLERLDAMLKKSAEVLALAEVEARIKRKGAFEDLERARKQAADEMRNGAGFRGANLKAYRDRSDAIAQFHKADIARQVVCSELLEKLQVIVEQALKEIKLWERILATAKVNEGGAYALVVAGQREVQGDRLKSKNAVRWVIDDDEPGDEYISGKYAHYSDGKLDQIMNSMKWEVGRLDGSKGLRIDFKMSDRAWDRQAGQTDQEANGQRNVAQLLSACRTAFEQAWLDMSVVEYLYANYRNDVEKLADLIFEKTGYPLGRTGDKSEPPMRTTFMRVHKQGLGPDEPLFLTTLRSSVARRYKESTDAEKRSQAQVDDYLHDSGEPSRDRFKLTFVMFGDLLVPAQVAGFQNARPAYEMVSGKGSTWKPLHILPAETHALAIEKDLTSGSSDTQQRRRELDDMVVAALEDIDRFQTAMRCLAYGQTDYDWGDLNENGLLLHRYSPPKVAGNSYWRLVLLPAGRAHADGRIYTATGALARPIAFQLTELAPEPDLLLAFVQLVCIGKDLRVGSQINWLELESTLDWAMEEHARLWVTKKDLGWQPTAEAGRNKRRLGEAHSQAAQIIRLNALINEADRALAKYDWCWRPLAHPDPTLNPEERTRVQRQMDLWSAIRGTAQHELTNLSTRLNQLGAWKGGIPFEKVDLEQAKVPPPTPDAPVTTGASPKPITPVTPDEPLAGHWTCDACGATNDPDAAFCDECGNARPAPKIKEEPIAPEDIHGKAGDEKEPLKKPEPVNENGNKAPELPVAAERVCEKGHPLPEPYKFCPQCGSAERVPPPTALRTCENGHPLPPAANFCPICGKPEAQAKPQGRVCENGHPLPEAFAFCPECGKPAKANGPRLLVCAAGHPLPADARFCPVCGATPAAA